MSNWERYGPESNNASRLQVPGGWIYWLWEEDGADGQFLFVPDLQPLYDCLQRGLGENLGPRSVLGEIKRLIDRLVRLQDREWDAIRGDEDRRAQRAADEALRERLDRGFKDMDEHLGKEQSP